VAQGATSQEVGEAKVRWLGAIYRKFKRRRYERWAREFAQRWDLPFEGVMLLAGYRV